MSGHSKWHRIKHQKAKTDSQRSKLFGRLSREIRVAAQAGSKDPDLNAALREAIERAKKFNLPQTNIDRLLNKDAASLSTVTYEGYGPNGVAILIEATTDNTNRTVSEMRTIFKQHGGSLGEPGSVRWKFSPSLHLTAHLQSLISPEEIELELIDAGADDINYENPVLSITSAPTTENNLLPILTKYNATDVFIEQTLVVPTNQKISLTPSDQAKLLQLLDAISDQDDVEVVYHDAQLN